MEGTLRKFQLHTKSGNVCCMSKKNFDFKQQSKVMERPATFSPDPNLLPVSKLVNLPFGLRNFGHQESTKGFLSIQCKDVEINYMYEIIHFILIYFMGTLAPFSNFIKNTFYKDLKFTCN